MSSWLEFLQKRAIASADEVPLEVPGTPRSTRINQEGIQMIKTFEGLHLEAYQDSVGIWTIGYGHTKNVTAGMKIDRAQAEDLLRNDLAQFESAVNDAVQVSLDDNQFSALVSFSFNLGAHALFESTLLKLLNQGKFQQASDEFPRWNKAGNQVLLGLTRRRRAERALFLSQPWEEFLHWQPNRVLRLAQPLMQGDDVRRVQKALVEAGFMLQVDGFFGEDTDKAVRQFQKQKGLTADGIVGQETSKSLGL